MTPANHEGLMRDFSSLLRVILQEFSVSGKEVEIVGKKYSFSCLHGSHFQRIIGTITGVSYSDELGLMLQVSNAEFFGMPIRGIFYDRNQGAFTLTAVVRSEGKGDVRKDFNGVFRIFDS